MGALPRPARLLGRALPVALLALCLLLLCTATAPAAALSLPSFLSKRPSAEDALIAWVRASGGNVSVTVGPIPGRGGLRGMMAAVPVGAGEPLVVLPSALSVPMGTAEYTTPENVMVLLARRAAEPGWWAEHGPHWASLPAPGTIFCKETFTADDLAELQDDDLAATANQEQAWIARVYRGEQAKLGVADLAQLQAAAGKLNVSFDEFQHLSALVASYAFLLPDDANIVRRVMLPLLDLLNHANDEAANAVVGREGGGEGGAFVARATRAIAAGEEVRFSYSNGNARNDHALLHYGFVNRDRAAEPLLACVDEPGGDLWACPDAEVGLLARAEKLNEKEREAEAQRLELILDAMKTSEVEDERVLTGLQSPHHWRRATLVHFRVLRKRALRRSIAILRGTDPNTTELRDFGKKGEAAQHTEL